MSGSPKQEPATTRVQIFGQTLNIKGAADEEYVQKLAAFVTANMERLSGESPLTPLPQVAMLAALNIAHELFMLRGRVEARETDLDNRARELLDSINAEVGTTRPEA